jgi:hypothetical protein
MRGGCGEGIEFGQGSGDSVLRGQPLFSALTLDNFLSELFVYSCKLSGPFNDPLIEFLCDPSLFAQETSLLQADGRLVCRNSQEEHFDLYWEIGPLRTSDQYSDLVLKPQP